MDSTKKGNNSIGDRFGGRVKEAKNGRVKRVESVCVRADVLNLK